jgi:hypothetical protein
MEVCRSWRIAVRTVNWTLDGGEWSPSLDGGEWSPSHRGHFTPREKSPSAHRINDQVDFRADLNALAERKTLTPAANWSSIPDRPVRNSATVPTATYGSSITLLFSFSAWPTYFFLPRLIFSLTTQKRFVYDLLLSLLRTYTCHLHAARLSDIFWKRCNYPLPQRSLAYFLSCFHVICSLVRNPVLSQLVWTFFLSLGAITH